MGGNSRIKNRLVVIVIILFILLILEPGINANQVITDLKQIKVNCSYEDEIDRWAVIIGISDYKGSSADLPCPAKEAQELYDMLISKDSRWDMNNVRLLLNGAAAKNNILSALDWLRENAGENDIILFSYNGHGSFVKDDNWDELDRRDETIVTWELDDITDDTLSNKFDEINTKNIEGMFLIFDCCFSGGIIGWKTTINENQRNTIKRLSKSTIFTNELVADIKTKNRVVLASTIPRGIGLELRGPDGWFSFTRGIITAIEKKRTTAEGISRYAKRWWLTNPTVIEVLFNPLLWYESLLYFLEEGVIIMPFPIGKDRYPQLLPKSKKLPIIGFCNIKSPIISDPSPTDGAQFISINLSYLSFHLKDWQGDLMDYTVETSPDIGSDSATNVPDGTFNVDISNLDIETEYFWYVNVTDGTNWKHRVFTFQTEPIMVFDPFEGGWKYRKKITIDHTQVAGDLTNFPVLVSTIDSDLRDKAQDDGDDILFMNTSGVATRLYHEIEYFDGSSGELIAWVNVTNLSSSEDTIFYMYYGNSNCINQQYIAGAWDSGFDAVWHMDYDDSIQDSTANDNDGTRFGSVTTKSGNIGKCQESYHDAAGSNYIESDDPFFNQDDTSFTWNFWIYLNNCDYYYGTLGTKDWHNIAGDGQNNYKGYSQLNSGKIVWYLDAGDGSATYIYTNSSVVGSWALITYQRNGNSVKIYHNGIEQEEGHTTWTRSSYTEMRLLIYRGGIYPGTWQRSLDGKMDEVQFSNVARSEAWILTTYNSQGDSSSFLSFGPEET